MVGEVTVSLRCDQRGRSTSIQGRSLVTIQIISHTNHTAIVPSDGYRSALAIIAVPVSETVGFQLDGFESRIRIVDSPCILFEESYDEIVSKAVEIVDKPCDSP